MEPVGAADGIIEREGWQALVVFLKLAALARRHTKMIVAAELT
jgi:hypothetical protein